MVRIEKSQTDFFQKSNIENNNQFSIRNSLSRNILSEFSGDPNTRSIRTFGSTANGTETIFSDMDYCVLVRGDSGLNNAIRSSSDRYQRIGPLIDWYQYNPYHHYVVFDSNNAPIPLDIYYLSDFIFSNVRKPKDTIFDAIQINQKEKHSTTEMIKTSYIKLSQAALDMSGGDYEGVISKLDELREISLIHLISNTFGYQIPHIKGIKFENFSDVNIKDLFIKTYAKPTKESCTESIISTLSLIQQINAKSEYPFNLIDESEIIRAIEKLDPSAIELLLLRLTKRESSNKSSVEETISQNGVIKIFRDEGLQHYLITKDDQSLNELLKTPQKISDFLGLRDPTRTVPLSPVHFRFKNQSKEIDCSFISSGTYYTSIGTNSTTIFEQNNPNQPSIFASGVPDIQIRTEKPEQIKELLLKGFIRTYRLLSKMKKNDYATIAYIVTAIRNEQVKTLTSFLSPLEKKSFLESDDYLNSFPRPTKEDCFKAILGLKNIFSNFYIKYQELFSDNTFNSFVEKIENIVNYYQN